MKPRGGPGSQTCKSGVDEYIQDGRKVGAGNNQRGCATQFSFEEKFKILACAMNRKGKTHEAIKERTQSANKSLLEQQFDSQKPGCSVDN